MQLGKYHCTIDEVTYDREELLEFTNQHRHNIMQFGDYMQYLSPEKREFKGRDGMNAIAVQKTEGKDLLEYPVVKKYVDMFNWKQYPGPRDIDLLHYDVGYKFQYANITRVLPFSGDLEERDLLFKRLTIRLGLLF